MTYRSMPNMTWTLLGSLENCLPRSFHPLSLLVTSHDPAGPFNAARSLAPGPLGPLGGKSISTGVWTSPGFRPFFTQERYPVPLLDLSLARPGPLAVPDPPNEKAPRLFGSKTGFGRFGSGSVEPTENGSCHCGFLSPPEQTPMRSMRPPTRSESARGACPSGRPTAVTPNAVRDGPRNARKRAIGTSGSWAGKRCCSGSLVSIV